MTQELAVVCPHRHRVRTAGRAHRALLLRPDLRSTLRNRVPVAGMRRRPRFSRAHDGQPGSPHRGTRQRNAGLWDNRPGSARAEEPGSTLNSLGFCTPCEFPRATPSWGVGTPLRGVQKPPLGPRSGGPREGFPGALAGGTDRILGPRKKAKKWPFSDPCDAKSRGSGGAPPTHLILLRNQYEYYRERPPPPRPARALFRGGLGACLLGWVGGCVHVGVCVLVRGVVDSTVRLRR